MSLCFLWITNSFQNQIYFHLFNYSFFDIGIQFYSFASPFSGASDMNYTYSHYFMHYSLVVSQTQQSKVSFLFPDKFHSTPDTMFSQFLLSGWSIIHTSNSLTHIFIPSVNALFQTLIRVMNAHKHEKVWFIKINNCND